MGDVLVHWKHQGAWPSPIRKEDAPCCVAQRDADGRLPIGFCGPSCVRLAQHMRRYGS